MRVTQLIEGAMRKIQGGYHNIPYALRMTFYAKYDETDTSNSSRPSSRRFLSAAYPHGGSAVGSEGLGAE